jgi:hypothetical protein
MVEIDAMLLSTNHDNEVDTPDTIWIVDWFGREVLDSFPNLCLFDCTFLVLILDLVDTSSRAFALCCYQLHDFQVCLDWCHWAGHFLPGDFIHDNSSKYL